MKSEYKGTCQCCGSVQKLPGNTLAKHGYTVKWGFFSGICSGTTKMPYEKDCSLIKQYIASAEAKRDSLIEFRDRLLKSATEPKAWFREYVRNLEKGRSGYKWRYTDLVETELGFCYINAEEKVTRLPAHKPVDTLLEMATLLNTQYAKDIALNIQNIAEYISWQQKRLTNWKETDLLPID